ncbi:ankyrin repeat domain-containing protein [bacterium]|nr:MAG: ankyrin repeat domain-containing protein [bacterium]
MLTICGHQYLSMGKILRKAPLLFNILLVFNTACTADKSKMLAHDIRLFQNNETWELAKAVRNEDTNSIHKLISLKKIPVDSKESKFGETLLGWSVITNHYSSTKALLEEGADPNLLETYSRKSPFMYACGYGPEYGKRTDLLKLLLRYGGKPNAVSQGQTPEGFKPRETPLMIAAKCCLLKTKLLVESGANVNFVNEKNESPLLSAVELGGNEKAETTRYLLLEKGADFRKAFVITIDKDTIPFAELLRHWVYPLGSRDYKIKMEIVNYLKGKGQDYFKTTIPPYFYKNYPKEYLMKY